mmetsp:Transcript_5483/g.13520  ORF Transcript_5483/g.13520 Transcript_5483/m.13520 type:complete len:263 (+) Transcript_5483:190-978(+)
MDSLTTRPSVLLQTWKRRSRNRWALHVVCCPSQLDDPVPPRRPLCLQTLLPLSSLCAPCVLQVNPLTTRPLQRSRNHKAFHLSPLFLSRPDDVVLPHPRSTLKTSELFSSRRARLLWASPLSLRFLSCRGDPLFFHRPLTLQTSLLLMHPLTKSPCVPLGVWKLSSRTRWALHLLLLLLFPFPRPRRPLHRAPGTTMASGSHQDPPCERPSHMMGGMLPSCRPSHNMLILRHNRGDSIGNPYNPQHKGHASNTSKPLMAPLS